MEELGGLRAQEQTCAPQHRFWPAKRAIRSRARRVRRAVQAQVRRAGVEAQDSDDVRTDVVLALLCAPAADVPLPLELVCARAAVIARNKAIDHGRRRARGRHLPSARDLPEPQRPGWTAGALADGLDEVTGRGRTAGMSVPI